MFQYRFEVVNKFLHLKFSNYRYYSIDVYVYYRLYTRITIGYRLIVCYLYYICNTSYHANISSGTSSTGTSNTIVVSIELLQIHCINDVYLQVFY